MCIGQRLVTETRPALADSGRSLNHAHFQVTSSTVPWTRTFKQSMKPMLPRKLTSSARINLNLYWNILEELVPCDMNMELQDGSYESFEDDVDMSNEINENIANERLEKSRGNRAMSPGLSSSI
ncbi:hypothetical protein C0J52_05983 [Blattella germanica]|nr:hypothetical protein C0J52_05983 [Blattella germanica]